MGNTMCPGQDTSFWRPGDIFEAPCSGCGYEVEFFKDDASRRCPACGQKVQNPKLNLGCAQWCEYAKDCLGYDPREGAPSEGSETPLVDRIIVAVKNHIGEGKDLTMGLETLEWAKKVMRTEDGNPKVILTAAMLFPLGADLARQIMKELEFRDDDAWEVEQVVTALGNGSAQSPEFKVVTDSRALAKGRRDEPWLTASARKIAAGLD